MVEIEDMIDLILEIPATDVLYIVIKRIRAPGKPLDTSRETRFFGNRESTGSLTLAFKVAQILVSFCPSFRKGRAKGHRKGPRKGHREQA